jgi:regulator of protease activity HflC (stomatin/prohibitin superfamily)
VSERTGGATLPEKALGDALRLSLRLLKVCIAAALAFYFGAGIFVVPEGSAGLVAVGGSLVRGGDGAPVVYGSGPHFTVPPPLGRAIIVPRQAVKQVATTGFWYHVEAEDALRALRRRSREKPLVPGRDGSLLCGDGALLHARLQAEYRVDDPVRYYRAFGLDEERERAVLEGLLEASMVREALTVQVLGADTGMSRLTSLFTDRVAADLSPAFADRGLVLLAVSPQEEVREPRQVEAAFLRRQEAAVNALREIQRAQRSADARQGEARARRETLLTEARVEAARLLRRVRVDLARARELAPLVAADPTLKRRLVLETFREVLASAVVHPILSRGGTSEYEVRLAPAPAGGESEEGER